jgi:hypothetical protein
MFGKISGTTKQELGSPYRTGNALLLALARGSSKDATVSTSSKSQEQLLFLPPALKNTQYNKFRGNISPQLAEEQSGGRLYHHHQQRLRLIVR